MRIFYKSHKQILFHKDLGTYETYAIDAYRQEKDCTFFLFSLSDAFLDADCAESFARLCTTEHIEPVQLADVLEDFLP